MRRSGESVRTVYNLFPSPVQGPVPGLRAIPGATCWKPIPDTDQTEAPSTLPGPAVLLGSARVSQYLVGRPPDTASRSPAPRREGQRARQAGL